jgi:hypothetical protein
LRRSGPGEAGDKTKLDRVVADAGEAEIGMQQINVILPVAGADYVGPLPAELQGYLDFAGSPEAAPLMTASWACRQSRSNSNWVHLLAKILCASE